MKKLYSIFIVLVMVVFLVMPSMAFYSKEFRRKEILLDIYGQKDSLSLRTSNKLTSDILDTQEFPILSDSLELTDKSKPKLPFPHLLLTYSDTPDLVIANTTINEPLVISNCSNAQIVNVTIKDIVNTSVSAITLENCPSSLIKNTTIMNVTSNMTYVTGINLINSDNTVISNSSVQMIASSSLNASLQRDAFGVVINSSENVNLTNVILYNLTSPTSSYGIYSIDSSSLSINDSYITNITSAASSGIYIDNCTYSLIKNTTITNLTSNIASVLGINIIDSDNTILSNNSFEMISSTSTSFLTLRDAFGVVINSSENVQLTKVILTNLTTNTFSYGIYSINSPSLSINDSIITNISSSASWGIYIENCDLSNVSNNNIAELMSSSFESSGIYVVDSQSLSIFNNKLNTIKGHAPLSGIMGVNSPSITITNNSISSLVSSAFQKITSGIEVDLCPNALIKNNTMFSIASSITNVTGVMVLGSEKVSVIENNISNIISTMDTALGIYADSSNLINISSNLLSQINSTSDNYVIPMAFDQKELTGYGIHIVNSNSSKIKWNSINRVEVWLSVDETSDSVEYENNSVNVNTAGLKKLFRPNDIRIKENDSSSIQWMISDDIPSTYTVYRNEQLLLEKEVWNISIDYVIELNIQNLTVGTYIYLIIFEEQNGIVFRDYAIITVYESIPPEIIEKPADNLYYQYGSPLELLLSWTINDDHPGEYSIYRNDTEISWGNWNSSSPVIVSVIGLNMGVYNYTLEIGDSTGNTVYHSVLVWVIETTDIFITRNTEGYIEYEIDTTGHNLNWTVVSLEGGSYQIHKESIQITTGAFSPATPILHSIDDLTIGTYNFTLLVIDNFGNTAHDSVIVRVVSNPELIDTNTTRTPITTPPYTIPPYQSIPPGEFPWLYVIGGLGAIGLFLGGGYLGVRRMMLPTTVKESQRGLKKARKIKDKSEEANKLGEIGNAYLLAGNYEQAIKHSKQALSMFKKLGDKKGQLKALEIIGDAYLTIGAEKK
jgi:hypothetical protein